MDRVENWVCPRCGRKFAHLNQAHSCVAVSVEDHFKDKPSALKETFYYLVEKVSAFGPIEIDAVANSINFGARDHFAAIYPLKNSLNLEFVTNTKIDSNRIFNRQMMGDSYIYHVKLINKIDVDSTLLSWLQQAYFLKS